MATNEEKLVSAFQEKNSIRSFLSPAHEVVAGDIVITMSGRAYVRLCVCILFPDDISETVSWIVFILHTHITQGV